METDKWQSMTIRAGWKRSAKRIGRRLLQVTDRTRASHSEGLKEIKERTEVRVDTVYVEKQSENTVAVAGPGVAIDKDGILTVNRSPLTFMKWLFAYYVQYLY